MKKLTLAVAMVIGVSGWILSDVARAETGAELLKSKGCLNCHDTDKKKVGPAFKEIAAKNAGKSAVLTAKIKDAKGHPKVNASEAEIKAAVDQVLSTK